MIVFDSSTLVLLSKIELLDTILTNYTKEITISESVEKESTIKKTFDGLLIKKRIEENKIKVIIIQDKKTKKLMEDFNINIGEAESIILALKNKQSILATDDKTAINACKLLNIPFTTAINILIEAKENNFLTKEETNIKLDKLSVYGRYKKEIIEDAKRRIKCKKL